MSIGRIILLIFGIIGLLISISLLTGGGALLWADNTIKDNEGYYTTQTIQVEKNSYAIVTGPAEIDIDVAWDWGWGWDLGDLIVFKIEGSNDDSAKQIFIGVARESDVNTYFSGVEYDEVIRFRIHPYRVDYQNHPGNIAPESPTSQTFWTESSYGTGTQTLEWELKSGSHSLVLMNVDGSAGIDMDIVLGAKVPLLFGVSIGLLVIGVVILALSVWMIYLALRKVETVPRMPSEALVSAESEGEKAQVEQDVIREIEEKTSVGLEPNIAGLLCYTLGWITGIIFFILEKDNKFIRFHALQSIVVFGVITIASAVLTWIPIFGDFFGIVIGILAFILWVVLMIKAYQGERYKIPWAGDFAEKQVS